MTQNKIDACKIITNIVNSSHEYNEQCMISYITHTYNAINRHNSQIKSTQMATSLCTNIAQSTKQQKCKHNNNTNNTNNNLHADDVQTMNKNKNKQLEHTNDAKIFDIVSPMTLNDFSENIKNLRLDIDISRSIFTNIVSDTVSDTNSTKTRNTEKKTEKKTEKNKTTLQLINIPMVNSEYINGGTIEDDKILRMKANEHYKNNAQKIMEQLRELNEINMNLPEQRTDSWYDDRHQMITASDFYKSIDGTTAMKNKIICNKVLPINKSYKQLSANAILHGKMFEPIATRLYEKKNKVIVNEYGCIPHPNKNIPIGASPDGICSTHNEQMMGRMLEIKCPYSRKIIFGQISKEYWCQMQGQMEVCNLEYCDFLECTISTYEENDDDNEQHCGEFNFYNDGDEYTTENGCEKGVIIEYLDESYNKCWLYPDNLCMSKKETYEWIAEHENNDKYKNNHEVIWWKLDVYSCILVERNRDWFSVALPKINEIWNDIIRRRQPNIGIDDIMPKKQTKQNKKKDFYEQYSVIPDECQIE